MSFGTSGGVFRLRFDRPTSHTGSFTKSEKKSLAGFKDVHADPVKRAQRIMSIKVGHTKKILKSKKAKVSLAPVKCLVRGEGVEPSTS